MSTTFPALVIDDTYASTTSDIGEVCQLHFFCQMA